MKRHQVGGVHLVEVHLMVQTRHQFDHQKSLVHQAPRCSSTTHMLTLIKTSGRLNSVLLVSQRGLEKQVHFTERINSLYLPIQGQYRVSEDGQGEQSLEVIQFREFARQLQVSWCLGINSTIESDKSCRSRLLYTTERSIVLQVWVGMIGANPVCVKPTSPRRADSQSFLQNHTHPCTPSPQRL